MIRTSVKPLLSGRSRFSRISRASVPSSIRSSFVITPIVRNPGQGKRQSNTHLKKLITKTHLNKELKGPFTDNTRERLTMRTSVSLLHYKTVECEQRFRNYNALQKR